VASSDAPAEPGQILAKLARSDVQFHM
jgi:hypothetical protein